MTLSAHDLQVFLNGLARLGYDVVALSAAAGLQPSDLETPDGRVPCEAYGAVLAGAQRERFTPNLALELAQVTPLGAWPLLDYLVLTADTVGAGVHQLARYFRLVGAPLEVRVHEDADPIRVEITAAATFAIEFDVALMMLHFRTETDGSFAAAVSFRHSPDDALAFERVLGCPVTTGASWSGISVSTDAWRLPLRRRDPILRDMLERHADAILARLPSRSGLSLEVQRALTSRVAGGDTRIESIGRQFAMSARTLQRKLAGEGTSYQRLLDDARKEAAGRYITESALPIGEVAYLLGYSEAAPFHRAFKRWYGRTPEGLRRVS